MGWYQTATAAFISFKTTAIEKVISAMGVASSVIPSPLKEVIYDTGAQIYASLNRVFGFSSIYAIYHSKETKKVLMQSAYTNFILYAAPFLVYDMMRRALPPEKEESNYQDVYEAMAILALIAMVRQYPRMLIDNAAYGLSIAKAVALEFPNKDKIKNCGCGEGKSKIADVVNLIDYFADLFWGYAASFIPRYGYSQYLSLGLLALTYGSCFEDYKLSSVGLCDKHRKEIYSKNKIFSLVYGVTFMSLVYGGNTAVEMITGVENIFVKYAISSFLFQYFIALSLVDNKPLPGRLQSVDVFCLSHMATEYLSRRTSQYIVYRMRQSNIKLDLTVVRNVANVLVNNFVARMYLYDDLQSYDKFVNRPAIHLFLDYYAEDLKSISGFVNTVKNNPSAYVFAQLPLNWWLIRDWIPQEYRDAQKIINVLLGKDLDIVVEMLNKTLSAHAASVKTIQYDKPIHIEEYLPVNEPKLISHPLEIVQEEDAEMKGIESVPELKQLVGKKIIQEEHDELDNWTLLDVDKKQKKSNVGVDARPGIFYPAKASVVVQNDYEGKRNISARKKKKNKVGNWYALFSSSEKKSKESDIDLMIENRKQKRS